MNKENCTEQVVGTIVKSGLGLIYYRNLAVEYEVDGKTHKLSDHASLKNKEIRMGYMEEGKSYDVEVADLKKGCHVQVAYNPQNPEEAYICGIGD